MPKKRFTNEQIAFALRQAENGTLVAEICRKMGVAEATFYRWKKVYAGMGVTEIRRLKQLEEENAKLKRLGADLSLDKTMLEDALQKSGEAHPSPRGSPALPGGVRRVGASSLLGRRLWTGIPSLQVAARLSASAAHAVEGLGGERRRFGYRRLQVLLKREGHVVNHKRVYRLYSEEGLLIRTRSPKRRRASWYRVGRAAAENANEVWSMDFVSDRLFDDRPFRILTIFDCHTRKVLATRARTNFRAYQVAEELDRLVALRCKPASIRVDNGPEFAGRMLDQWAYLNKINWTSRGRESLRITPSSKHSTPACAASA